MTDSDRIERLLCKIQQEFLDNPDLALTEFQAQRRFGADTMTCAAILDALASAGVLTRVNGGTYVRWFPRMAA